MRKDVFDVSRTDRDAPSQQEPASQPAPLRALLSPVTDTHRDDAQSPVPAGRQSTAPAVPSTPPSTPANEPSRDLPDPAVGERHPDTSRHRPSVPDSTGLSSTRPRGAGGKAAEPDRAGRITAVPARVPGDLYEATLGLVKGVGKPSWGQLVAWTCEDHHDEVLAHLQQAAVDAAHGRRPRGQNRPGAAGVQVTARLSVEELRAVEDLRLGEAARTNPDEAPTRTAVVVAALNVARQHSS